MTEPSDPNPDRPPPPPGGYPPPPPPGGYPPPPPPGGYPPPAPQKPPFRVGDAFNWAWNKFFSSRVVALVVPFLVYYVAITAITGAIGSPQLSGGAKGAGAAVAALVGYAFAFVAQTFVQMAYLSGCLDIADGQPVTIASFFKPRNLGPGIGAALLVGVCTGIGYLLCIIPGLVFGFLAQFTIPFVIDRSLSPVDALKASITTAKNHVGGALLSYLVQVAVLWVGGLLFGVGLLAAFPIAVLIQVYTYRRLSGGQIAPAH
jgi:uncharacterized membrane protein